ncbi:DUF4244 domain-containing protein [Sphaerisporangium corydalis]|uniref:DUF4244 domain-containing protein n=1 Tax=Sphaerisporangium corydalis TaxID=1441875 RepID=A0ABV9EHN0_9ACTN|nr:DUF4244 domain-containing protein [Sphaerisporangium corydalis]
MRRWISGHGRRTSQARRLREGHAIKPGLRRWLERVRASGRRLAVLAHTRAEAGMSTAEYAVGTIAACAFAGLLFKIVSSQEVRKMLSDIIARALKLAG